ncbi:MAG: RNB domain-containing ribonuclease [Propionibacteriaceae bacterium]|nr:RNB domain-containing ribonuclease [Propionibacteriaceae bacterium]
MPARKVRLPSEAPQPLLDALSAIRLALKVPDDFPSVVLAAAADAASQPRLPGLDQTGMDFVTIDPPGSRDLDQALHIARAADGFTVSYAVADVAAFVTAGDAVDREAHLRGCTLYAPDRRSPLHPPVLGEDAASLLPGRVRPALVWTMRLDAHAKLTDAEVVRAMVTSRERLSYQQAQAEIDSESARETLALLKEVGELRLERERERGGISLQIPEQEVRVDGDEWTLDFRCPLPVEDWNAQISLLTGMAAADIMLYGQIGILRTLPPADNSSMRRLHQCAKALHIGWPPELTYPEFVGGLDPACPDHAAMLNACAHLFRGAGYRAFSGGIPTDVEHSALAVEYAHTTAPLRRLVDRYAGEICLSLCADQPVPDWVLQALDALPEEMTAAERRAKKYERCIVDLTEVFLLADRVGETFSGTVIEVDQGKSRGVAMIKDPAVEARIVGVGLPLGHEVSVRLTSADYARGAVEFELA